MRSRIQLLALGALAFAVPRVVTAAETPRPLLRVEGREETFGLLCCPQHAIGYYAVEVFTDGRLRSAVDGYPGTVNREGAPTFLFADGKVEATEMAAIRSALAEARIGSQDDCELPVRTAYLFFASASANPVQRFTWFGRNARTNSFALDVGAQCPAPVAEIVVRLRHAFREALVPAASAAGRLSATR